MMRPLLPFCALAPLLAPLLAQDGPPTFVVKHCLAMIRVEDIPKLLEQLPRSTVGKLLDDKEVGGAFAAGLARFRARAQRRSELVNATRTVEVDLDPWMAAQMAAASAWATLRELDLADMQRFEIGDLLLDGDNLPRFANETFYASLGCKPRAEGRWTATFERLAKEFATSKQWSSEADGKFAGFPAYQFLFAAKAGENRQEMLEYYGEQRTWLLHLPGVFAFGGATPEQCGSYGQAPARPPAQIVGEMNLAAFGEMFQRVGGRVPMEFSALGFDGLKALRWRLRFLGADVLDEIEVELGDEPKGLVGALLVGKAALPAQPLPAGALAQIRGAFDLEKLASCLPMLGAPELPSELLTLATKALTGGIALGACAPAQGALIPRIYLSLGVADAKALDELLAKLFPDASATKQVTYEDVPCTVLTVPDMPRVFQPTWCTIDGVLHVAESAKSMRAFLEARTAGGTAMDVGAAPEPPGEGEVLPTLDVRCDQQELYRTFHKVWLPLVKLISGRGEEPLLEAGDMPSPEAALPWLGKSRGVLRREGKVYRLQQLGPLGGLAAAGLAMTWGPIVSGPFHGDYVSERISQQLAHKKLDAIWASFEAFEKEHKRRPVDLGELFASDKKLAPDALLLPGDDKAEPVPLPAGDARTIVSSFRYFKDGVQVDVNGNQQKMLLIAIATARYNRPMLGDDGSTPEFWGEDNHKPIDRFGK